MKLILDLLDLRPEHKSISCRSVNFEHLNEKAQRAIISTGQATFYEYDHSNYNVIHPPKERQNETTNRSS